MLVGARARWPLGKEYCSSRFVVWKDSRGASTEQCLFGHGVLNEAFQTTRNFASVVALQQPKLFPSSSSSVCLIFVRFSFCKCILTYFN